MEWTTALVIAVAVALPAAGLAQTCPPPADRTQETGRLLDAVQDAPNERAARIIGNQLWEIWATAPDATAQEILDRGLRLRSSYDFAGAVRAFEELIDYCPGYAEGYNQRAFISYLRQDFISALPDLEKALELSPFHVAALSGKALTLIGLGREDEAQIVLREALRLNPWLPERGLLKDLPGEEL